MQHRRNIGPDGIRSTVNVPRRSRAAVALLSSVAAVAATALSVLGSAGPASAANTITQSFTSVTCGSWHYLSAPPGATEATITITGGGGGGSGGSSGTGGSAAGAAGGDGAQIAATYTVSAGQTLDVWTGCGGGGGSASGGVSGGTSTSTAGGTGAAGGLGTGGNGGVDYGGGAGGGGGGDTALCLSNSSEPAGSGCNVTYLAIAGGGGGAGGAGCTGAGGSGGPADQSGETGTGTTTSGDLIDPSTTYAKDNGQPGTAGGNSANTGGNGGFNDDSGGAASSSGQWKGAAGGNENGGVGGAGTSSDDQNTGGGGGGAGWGGGAGGTGSKCSGDGGAGGGGGGNSFINTAKAVSYASSDFAQVSGSAANCGAKQTVCTSGTAGSGGDAGASGSTTSADTGGPGSASSVVWTGTFDPSKLAITSAAVSGSAGSSATLGAITVSLEDSNGTLDSLSTATTVSLSSSSTGTHEFSATSGGAAVTSVSIPAGQSSATFYYGDELAGTPTITASASGLTSATQKETISPSSPSSLAFSTEPPSSGTAGVALSPAFSVSVEDAYGNVEASGTGSTDSITLGVASGPGGGAIASGATAIATGGVATFSEAVIEVAGSYTLSATDSSEALSGATSSGVEIGSAAPATLAFVTEPSDTAAGSAMSPAVSVSVEDAFANPVADSGVVVTLAPSAGSIASGASATTDASGLATFSSLTFDATGSGLTLSASSPGLATSPASVAFDVTAAGEDQLVFATEPAPSVVAGSTLAAVSVAVEDAYGNVVTTGAGSSDQVSLSLSSGAFSSGTLTETASAGVANFGDLVIDSAGSDAITAADATDGSVAQATSSSFTVTPAAASQLVFSAEPPASGAAGVALSPAFSVSVEDAFGNVETTGTGSTDTITLGVASGPGDGSIASGASATASGGVATFSDAVIDVAGSYTLSGADSSEGAISGATSTSVDIAAAASSVVVTSSANPSGYAKAVTLSATVTGNDSLGAPGGTVEFDDLTYSDTVIAGCATAPLSASGSDTSTATCSYTPRSVGGTGGTFTVVATSSGDSSYGGSASPAFSQVVLGSGHALLALSFSENPVPYAGSVTLTATLTFTSGSGTPGGTISFVDLTDNQTLCTVMAPTGVDHQATCAFSPPRNGTEGGVFTLEATYSGDSDYAFADDHQTLTELGSDQASVAVTSSKPDKAATEGQTMVLYATVSGAEGMPSGSAVFSVDGSPITCVGLASTSVHVNPEGEAVCKWQPEAAGTYAVTAGYSGDTTYAPLATSPTYDQLVDGMVATTAATPVLTSPPAPPGTAGEPITVTDAVTTSVGQVTTGDVAFSETISGTTSVACASEPVDATGTASCTFTPFAGSVGGAVKVTASYLGSGDDAPSAASPSLSVPVLGANLLSSFVVTSNADPAGAAKVVTLTATLSGSVGTPTGTPTGTATFTDDGTVISCNGGTTPPKLSGSSGTATATCRYTPSGAGSDTIDASYGGDVDYAPASTPADFTQEVDGTGAVTSVAVTSAADPNAYDTSVTLTATVAAPSTPTGTVDFSATVAGQQADLCPTAVLSGTGGVATASCVYDPAVQGNAGQVATIRATYSGDATYAPKGSGVFTQTEDGTASLDAFTLSSNLNPSGSNKVVTFTATLTGQTTPTGTVTFTDARTPICTAAKVSASGVAICHLALSGAGDHQIAATYSGDATYAAATSPSDLDQQVS